MDQSTSAFTKFLEDYLQTSSTKTHESQSSKSRLPILPPSIIRYTFSCLTISILINVLVYNGLLTFWTSNRETKIGFIWKIWEFKKYTVWGKITVCDWGKGTNFCSSYWVVHEIRSPLYNYVTAAVKYCLAKVSVITTLTTSQRSI